MKDDIFGPDRRYKASAHKRLLEKNISIGTLLIFLVIAGVGYGLYFLGGVTKDCTDVKCPQCEECAVCPVCDTNQSCPEAPVCTDTTVTITKYVCSDGTEEDSAAKCALKTVTNSSGGATVTGGTTTDVDTSNIKVSNLLANTYTTKDGYTLAADQLDFSGGILDKFRFTIVNDGDTAIEPELRLFLYDSGQSETTNEYTLIKGRFNSTTPLARGKSLRKALTVNAVYDGTSENFKLELWDMILKKRLVTHRTDFSE